MYEYYVTTRSKQWQKPHRFSWDGLSSPLCPVLPVFFPHCASISVISPFLFLSCELWCPFWSFSFFSRFLYFFPVSWLWFLLTADSVHVDLDFLCVVSHVLLWIKQLKLVKNSALKIASVFSLSEGLPHTPVVSWLVHSSDNHSALAALACLPTQTPGGQISTSILVLPVLSSMHLIMECTFVMHEGTGKVFCTAQENLKTKLL